ncbi:MAG: hypothetical protein IJF61_04155 [Clostridia bacterium]|nr:hypothetical protein [Clostridia bacterium]
MKKLIALLLAVICAFSLVACAGGGNEAKATKSMENFLNALKDLDVDGMKAAVDDPDALPESLENLDIDNIMKTIPSELSAYSEDFKGVITALYDRAKSHIAYDIKNVEENDDEFVFTVEVTMPEFNTDFQNLFTNSLDEDALMNIALDLYSSGKITPSSTQSEVMDALMPEVVKIMNDTINDIEIKTTTAEKEFVVVEEDGEWLVSVKKSDLD